MNEGMMDQPRASIGQGERTLICLDDWFGAPDGLDYKLAWGRCYYHAAKELFGFDPKAGANFFVTVGVGDGSLMVAGCRLHYAVRSDTRPMNRLVYIPPSER